MNDPVLDAARLQVEPLAALTQPLPTTFTEDDKYVYFKSSMNHVNAIRSDGKRLTFHNFYFKTNIEEDIQYLRELIRVTPGGVFSECKSGDELFLADSALDPTGAMERRVRSQVLAELAAAGQLVASGDDKNEAPVDAVNTDSEKISGTDAATVARARLEKMRAASSGADSNGASVGAVIGNPLNPQIDSVASLTPGNTTSLAGPAAGSNSLPE